MTTAVFLAPLSVAGGPFFIPGGNQPAAGGQLFSYITGSSTKLATYTTSSGAVANSNPIVLDSGGFVTGSGEVWLIQSSTYRFILAPSTDTDPPGSPYWTRDSISGINDVQTQLNANAQEWIVASTTPVFSNASSFVISGDQRSIFTVGRRVKTTNSGGTVYGTITSSAFTTSTAVGIVPDSGGMDAGLNAVSYGLLSTPNGSIPWINVSSTGLEINSDIVSTRGIFFPATQVPSSNVNILDDYEEGTWTPTVTAPAGAAGYSTQIGFYTKVGRTVNCSFDVFMSSKGTLNGGISIGGFPFLVSSNYVGASPIQWRALATNWVNIFLVPTVNTSSGNLMGATAAGPNANLNVADTDLSNSSRAIGVFSYIAT